VAGRDARHAHLNWEFGPVGTQRCQVGAGVQHLPFPSSQKVGEAAVMRISETRRDDQLRDLLTDSVRTAASEHPFGRRVEVADLAFVVDRDDPVESSLEDSLGSLPRGPLACQQPLSLLLSLKLCGYIRVRPEPADDRALLVANGLRA
jgi:hypothetical protein